MKMSLSPTNCRTVPEASVLTMTFGTPSGSARIAAVPIVVPGRAAEAEDAGDLAARMRLTREPRRAFGRTGHRLAAVAFCRIASSVVPASAKICSRVTSAATAGAPSEPTSTSVVAHAASAVEQVADEGGFAAFRVERGEEQDGGHHTVRATVRASRSLYSTKTARKRFDHGAAPRYSRTPAMRISSSLLLSLSALTSFTHVHDAPPQEPLRVFIRSGPEVARSGRARLSALPEGMGAAAQRARREGGRRRGLPDQGAARPDGRPDPAQAGRGHDYRPGRSPEPERLPRPRRRPRGDSRRGRLERSRLVQGRRRRLVAERHDQVARRADAPLLHRPRQPDHEGRRRTGRWTTRSTTTWTSCPRRGSWPRRTRRSRPARNAELAEARRGAHRRRQARQHLRHPAADVDLRAHRRGRRHAVSRVRVDSRASLRELQPPELPRDSAARHRLGRQARERRRAPEERRARRRPALRRRRADRSGESRGEDRGASGVRSDARRRRAAHPESDEHRLGREGPAVGLGNSRVSQRPPRAEHRHRGRTAARCTPAQDARSGGHDLRSSPTRTATA